jgi:hypothetical protein
MKLSGLLSSENKHDKRGERARLLLARKASAQVGCTCDVDGEVVKTFICHPLLAVVMLDAKYNFAFARCFPGDNGKYLHAFDSRHKNKSQSD